MPRAIKRAVAAGVRSIEHGNFLDDEAADAMAAAGEQFLDEGLSGTGLPSEGQV